MDEDRLNWLLDRLNEEQRSWHLKNGHAGEPAHITMERGPRYIRLVREDGSSRSAYGFIDMRTGDILKAASWKAPAKGIRGNIDSVAPMAAFTPYGVVYAYR